MKLHLRRASRAQVNPLWTRDFTIITLGSVVSMLGNSLSGFAMSLMVLDYTDSAFFYALYIVIFTLPQVLMPVFSGAILDRFSRKKTIYTLDFVSAGLYAATAVLMGSGWFSFPVFALYSFLVGSINSIYTVAYQSFYPLLISEGNFSKAYSVSSVLETMATLMAPVAAYIYNLVGIAPVLGINAVLFFVAAVMETRITAKEAYIERRKTETSAALSHGRRLFSDIREGMRYLASERGLLVIAGYFVFMSLAGGAASVVTLPYFRGAFENGEYIYMLVWGMNFVGRAVGGAIHYRVRLPRHRKYIITLVVYITVGLIDGFYFYFSLPVMMALFFIGGVLAVTSYTIRVAATQHYVPDEKKGRFNGAFQMMNTVGTLSGELLAGALTIVLPMRGVVSGFMLLGVLAAIFIVGGNRKHVEKIYNTDA